MRIFAVPAALVLGCCLYMPLPTAHDALFRLINRAYDALLPHFTRRTGKTDDAHAFIVFLLLTGGMLALLGAIHPLVSMALMAPAFTGVRVLPRCAAIKDELDSGKYARDIPAYESLVRETCAALAPAFVSGVIAPLILCSAGMPLHLGAALSGVYLALQAISSRYDAAMRAISAMQRFSEHIFIFFLLLCSGSVGRNPLHTKGSCAQDRLLSILSIAPGEKGRAPMAGDIAQGVFLCCFCSCLLCLLLTMIGFIFC